MFLERSFPFAATFHFSVKVFPSYFHLTSHSERLRTDQHKYFFRLEASPRISRPSSYLTASVCNFELAHKLKFMLSKSILNEMATTNHGNKYPYYRKWSLNKEFAVQSLCARRDHICQTNFHGSHHVAFITK